MWALTQALTHACKRTILGPLRMPNEPKFGILSGDVAMSKALTATVSTFFGKTEEAFCQTNAEVQTLVCFQLTGAVIDMAENLNTYLQISRQMINR